MDMTRALWLWIALALAVMPVIFFKTAPYGRHTPANARFTLQSRYGWCLMETPSVLMLLAAFVMTPVRGALPFVFLALWQLHYVNRAFIYPFRMRGGDRPMPWAIVLSAFSFTALNGFFNGWAITHNDYTHWASDPRCALGALVFLLGFAINQHADHVLRNLRKPGDSGYHIPHGGLYRFISCPNYFGELVEWSGWAIATWSLAGCSFALWTLANLLPRALAHHAWYRRTFPDYPPTRRALIPFLLVL